jgi:hypothetical protein
MHTVHVHAHDKPPEGGPDLRSFCNLRVDTAAALVPFLRALKHDGCAVQHLCRMLQCMLKLTFETDSLEWVLPQSMPSTETVLVAEGILPVRFSL